MSFSIQSTICRIFRRIGAYCQQSASVDFGLICYFYMLGGVGATFAIGTTLATKIRDKDDYKSWAIGAGMAGSLFGFRRKFIRRF